MQKLPFIWLAVIVLLLSTSGCEQKFCCGSVTDHYICIRDTSSVDIDIAGRLDDVHARLVDSLNYYQGMGYACRDNENQKGPSWWASCVYGLAHRRQAINGGDSCGSAELGGLCSSGNGCD